MEKHLAGHDVPDFVRSFLFKHWRLFLESIYAKYSENSVAWNAARQTMDDLISSVDKPGTHYAKQQQAQIFPGLLFRLLNGMKVISMNDEEIDKFLRKLKHYQIDSLHQSQEPFTGRSQG